MQLVDYLTLLTLLFFFIGAPLLGLFVSSRSQRKADDAFAALSAEEIWKLAPTSSIPATDREFYRLIALPGKVLSPGLRGSIFSSSGQRVADVSYPFLKEATVVPLNGTPPMTVHRIRKWVSTSVSYRAANNPEVVYVRAWQAMLREMQIAGELATFKNLEGIPGRGFYIFLNGEEIANVFRPLENYYHLVAIFNKKLPDTVSLSLPLLSINGPGSFVSINAEMKVS